MTVRNIEYCTEECSPSPTSRILSFSIKNNLPYTVSDVRILILVYDATGTVVDYNEGIYNEDRSYGNEDRGIRPFLARSVDENNYRSGYDEPPHVTLKTGYKVKARVLDFKIIEGDK